ncbi:MAG: hypothetical protein AAB481_00795 [Patescibacteria group bacterium]|mgnify:CR=1 FL=1
MAPHANVFVAEDDPKWLELIKDKLEAAGHSYAGEATTREEAIRQIPTFREKNINVVILGGNLGDFVFGGDSPDNDSVVMLKAMREAGYEELPTIGLSGVELTGVTVDLGKMEVSQLGETVTVNLGTVLEYPTVML